MARSMPGAARLVLLLDAVFSAGRQAALVGQEKKTSPPLDPRQLYQNFCAQNPDIRGGELTRYLTCFLNLKEGTSNEKDHFGADVSWAVVGK